MLSKPANPALNEIKHFGKLAVHIINTYEVWFLQNGLVTWTTLNKVHEKPDKVRERCVEHGIRIPQEALDYILQLKTFRI